MSKIRIVDVGKKFGNMNTAKRFYPDWMTKEEIREDFMRRRLEMGEHYGFNGALMYMADQVKKNGSYFEITSDYVEANPKGWTDIPEDILVITDKLPGVVIGHPVADCPVVMMSDVKQGVTAIAHCSAELIDMRMPMMVADALQKAYDCKDDDIIAYISACAGTGWTYDSYPKWATDRRLWDGAITMGDDNLFHINMRKVIANELRERNISNVTFSSIDTITNPNYYSNSASSPYGLNDASKAGRNFAGAFYYGCYNVKTKNLERTR